MAPYWRVSTKMGSSSSMELFLIVESFLSNLFFVVIILKDESGNIIEANSTPLFEDGNDLILYPQQREFFTLSLDSDSDKVFSKEVEIYYDVFDDTTLDVDESQGDELDLEFN